MNNKNFILIIFLFFICSCSVDQKTTINKDEYDIIAEIVNTNFKGYPADKRIIILNETWIKGEDYKSRKEIDDTKSGTLLSYYNMMLVDSSFGIEYKDKWDFVEMIEDYKTKNRNKSYFDLSRLNLHFNCSLLKKIESDSIFTNIEVSWENFYSKFPDALGFIRISRAGFNVANTEAIIWVEILRGGLDATFDYYFLRKIDNSWEIISVDNVGQA